MYIYHALINALSTHMIHVNLNMIFYTHVEHSLAKKYYMEKHTDAQARTQAPPPPNTPTHTHIHHPHTHTHRFLVESGKGTL